MKRSDFVPGLLALLLVVGQTACSDKNKGETAAPEAVPTPAALKQAAGNQQQFDGLIIHFKKPSDWGEPRLYLFRQTAPNTEEYCGEWPGSTMKPEGNGWYVFSVAGVQAANTIFSDGNNQIPKPLWPQFGFERQKGEWWYDGAWHSANPEPPASPTPQKP